MTVHILLVEDEVKLARFVELELSSEGYQVSVAHHGIAGFNTLGLRIIVGWVERSETQQTRENVGFRSSTQPTHLRGFWR